MAVAASGRMTLTGGMANDKEQKAAFDLDIGNYCITFCLFN